MDELVAWKDSTQRKPLILNGARQVGKTWQRWYWRHAEDDCRWSRGKASMDEIRRKYGSEWLERGKEDERQKLPA